MLADLHEKQVVFSDSAHSQQIVYHPAMVSGPAELAVGSAKLSSGCLCRFGRLTDTSPVVDSFRSWRKNIFRNVEIRGFIPFASQIAFRHVFHNGPGFVSAITDITIPRKTTVDGRIEIASVILHGEWDAVTQFVGNAGDTSPIVRQPIPRVSPGTVIKTWPVATPALVFEKHCGARIEIGAGNDIWRWENGFGPHAESAGFELAGHEDGLVLHRVVSGPEATSEIPPRCYRFSWYMAWSDKHVADAPLGESDHIEPVWSDTNDIDFDATRRRIRDQPAGSVLHVDFDNLDWPVTLRRSPSGDTAATNTGGRCFASNRTLARCRRIIRQLAALDAGAFPIHFSGLLPGVCVNGRHLLRPGNRSHWDLPAIMQFAAWTRQQFDQSRSLSADTTAMPCPSLNNLFTAPLLHHENDN